jgi:signal transduction histidine kinase
MGIGIWAMHFVGMLAFHLPVQVSYHWPTALGSLLTAIVASAAALNLVSHKKIYVLVSGTILGCGVAALHYINMFAMRMAAVCEYSPVLVVLSIALAIAFAVGAMWLGFYFRDQPNYLTLRRIESGVVLGAAVSAMHYTGMAAATFYPSGKGEDLTHTVTISSLGTLGIAAVTLILLSLAILSSFIDRRFHAQGMQLTSAEGQLELMRTTRLAMMGELTASIAHEIKQPLAAIVANGDFCLRQLGSSTPDLAKIREAIDEIVNDGNRASTIISQIRAILTRSAPDRVALDVNAVIRAVLSFVRREIDQNNISVRMDLAEDLPHVLGEEVQLQQVLINLIMNSIDAMRTTLDRPRELVIKSLKTAQGVHIQIQDSGPGLDIEIVDRIFEPFFTTKPAGVGLGLSISRSIVESHGGRMWYTQGSRGALFEFTLPDENHGC